MDEKKWTVCVTTAPRRECTCVATLESLEDCGWNPVVFAEPGSSPTGDRVRFDNPERLGVWHNWLRAARWALDQASDYIMTVQDDTDFHPESRLLIESTQWPEDAGYISLYTPKHYQQWKNGTPRQTGLYSVKTQSMWGAVALVFKPKILRALIDHPRAISWVGSRCKKKSNWPALREKRLANPHMIQNSDTIIGSILTKTFGLKLYYFNPSPCAHIATHSTCGHGGNRGRRNAWFIADSSIPIMEQINGSWSTVK